MLEISNLSKAYATPRGPVCVLSNVSATFAPGDAVSIMGPSGSGKSTFLYIIGALEPPSSGRVMLDGVDPFALGEASLASLRNRQIGFVFQDHCLLPQCSVLENVLIPTLVAPVDGRGGKDDFEQAKWLLERVGLSDRLAHRPMELSGGEKQRVALARALIRKPLLLLCDEPTGNLDRAASSAVAELLLDLHRQQNTILIVVTHNAELGARMPTRYELLNGELIRTA